MLNEFCVLRKANSYKLKSVNKFKTFDKINKITNTILLLLHFYLLAYLSLFQLRKFKCEILETRSRLYLARTVGSGRKLFKTDSG